MPTIYRIVHKRHEDDPFSGKGGLYYKSRLRRRIPDRERVHGSLDLLNYGLPDDEWDDWISLSKARLLGRFKISPHLALFGGPTFNVLFADDAAGRDLAPWSVYDAEVRGTYVRLWPGATLGVRLTTRTL